jgi:hypothetical protein
MDLLILFSVLLVSIPTWSTYDMSRSGLIFRLILRWLWRDLDAGIWSRPSLRGRQYSGVQ